jgi:hypothetical protein
LTVQLSGIASNLGEYYKAEDTVSAVFSFDTGLIGSGSWSFVVDKYSEEDMVVIKGTKGEIKFSCFNDNTIELTINGKQELLTYQNPENIQYNLINQIVESLRGDQQCVSTMYSASRTNYVLEQIVKSYYGH